MKHIPEEYTTEDDNDNSIVEDTMYGIPTSILKAVTEEMQEGEGKFGKFNSDHEFYAVLLEEVEEFWDELKADAIDSRKIDELVQVCAVALRGLIQIVSREAK